MIGLMIASALAQAAPEPQWRLFNHDPRGDGFIDLASLRRDGTNFDVTIRIHFSSDQAAGVRSVITRYHFDCVARTLANRHVLALDSSGAVLADADISGPEAAPVAPPAGTPGDIVLNEYCTPATA